jgi:hypothetical protein
MADECRPVMLPTRETILVRGSGPYTGQGVAALAEVVATARRMTPPPSPEAVDLHGRLDAVRTRWALLWRGVATEAGVRPSVLSRLANGIMPDEGDRGRLESWLRTQGDP